MPDAHAAAVEAMAGAIMRPDVRAHYEAHPDPEALAYYRERARDGLAALVRSEAVRAALVEAFVDLHPEPFGAGDVVDAILAALAPGEAT